MILVQLLELYSLILFIRIIISWVHPDPYNPIVRFLYGVTDPVLNPLRRLIPPLGGMIDLSPLAAFLIIHLLKMLIIKSLYY
ncbi:YggT family protein [bacterium]|nr:YggT family protein [bacterium]